MILKSYEIDKINFDNQKLFLFYGKSKGLTHVLKELPIIE